MVRDKYVTVDHAAQFDRRPKLTAQVWKQSADQTLSFLGGASGRLIWLLSEGDEEEIGLGLGDPSVGSVGGVETPLRRSNVSGSSWTKRLRALPEIMTYAPQRDPPEDVRTGAQVRIQQGGQAEAEPVSTRYGVPRDLISHVRRKKAGLSSSSRK